MSIFAEIDVNGDQKISFAEFAQYVLNRAAKTDAEMQIDAAVAAFGNGDECVERVEVDALQPETMGILPTNLRGGSHGRKGQPELYYMLRVDKHDWGWCRLWGDTNGGLPGLRWMSNTERVLATGEHEPLRAVTANSDRFLSYLPSLTPSSVPLCRVSRAPPRHVGRCPVPPPASPHSIPRWILSFPFSSPAERGTRMAGAARRAGHATRSRVGHRGHGVICGRCGYRYHVGVQPAGQHAFESKLRLECEGHAVARRPVAVHDRYGVWGERVARRNHDPALRRNRGRRSG